MLFVPTFIHLVFYFNTPFSLRWFFFNFQSSRKRRSSRGGLTEFTRTLDTNTPQPGATTPSRTNAGSLDFLFNQNWLTLLYFWRWSALHNCTLLYCIVLYCIVLYCIVLYCTVLYCTVLYCTVLFCTVLYCIVLYCTVLYSTALYCTVLYCTILYCIVLYYTVLYCTEQLCDAWCHIIFRSGAPHTIIWHRFDEVKSNKLNSFHLKILKALI